MNRLREAKYRYACENADGNTERHNTEVVPFYSEICKPLPNPQGVSGFVKSQHRKSRANKVTSRSATICEPSWDTLALNMRLPRFIAPSALKFSRYLFGKFGFELTDLKPYNRDIKDAEFYQPMFSPWLMPEWRNRLRADDPRSVMPIHAKYVFYCLVSDAILRCDGEVAECGVYKGGTAKILAERVSDRPIHLFDTFAGMPETDPVRDRHKAGDFADTDVESVRQYLREHKNVTCVPGFVPDTLNLIRERTFSFVHIDLDIYPAIKSACEFFYARMQKGGIMLFDDYGYPSCPGARMALDEFFADKPEVKMVFVSGQCSVQKH